MADWKAKRFWKSAQVIHDAQGYGVTLDGRPVKTPLKTPIRMPTREMAQAVAAEWDAQEGTIDPMSMPVTRAVNATLDKVIPQFAEVADMLAEYGGSDLLCYRAETPAELIARQAAAWDPLLEWAASEHGARLAVTTGIFPVAQDADAMAKLRAAVHGVGPFQMAALHEFVTLSGSLVIGLAAMAQSRPDPELWDLSRIDENWQIEQWGHDDEAAELAETKRAAFLQAGRFRDMT